MEPISNSKEILDSWKDNPLADLEHVFSLPFYLEHKTILHDLLSFDLKATKDLLLEWITTGNDPDKIKIYLCKEDFTISEDVFLNPNNNFIFVFSYEDLLYYFPSWFLGINILVLINNSIKKYGEGFWKHPEITGTEEFQDCETVFDVCQRFKTKNVETNPFLMISNPGGEFYPGFNYLECDTTFDPQKNLSDWLLGTVIDKELHYYNNHTINQCYKGADEIINSYSEPSSVALDYIKDDLVKRTNIALDDIEIIFDYSDKDFDRAYVFKNLTFMKSLLCDLQFPDCIYKGHRLDLTQANGEATIFSKIIKVAEKTKVHDLNSIYDKLRIIPPVLIQKKTFSEFVVTHIDDESTFVLNRPDDKSYRFLQSIFSFNKLNHEEINLTYSKRESPKKNRTIDLAKNKMLTATHDWFDLNKILLLFFTGYDLKKNKFNSYKEEYAMKVFLERLHLGSVDKVLELYKSLSNENFNWSQIVKIDSLGNLYSDTLETFSDSIIKFDFPYLVNLDLKPPVNKIWTVPKFISEELQVMTKFIRYNSIFKLEKEEEEEIIVGMCKWLCPDKNIDPKNLFMIYDTCNNLTCFKQFSKPEIVFKSFTTPERTGVSYNNLTNLSGQNDPEALIYQKESKQLFVKDLNSELILDHKIKIPQIFSEWVFLSELFEFILYTKSFLYNNCFQRFYIPEIPGLSVLKMEKENYFYYAFEYSDFF